MTWFIFGDSHIGTFKYAAEQGWIARPCAFLQVAGATAVGLRNPNSQTNALEAFASALLPAKLDVTPVMQLGEVDCGFVIWWRAAKLGESVASQLEASVDAHLAFADRLLREGYASLVLTGASLPTIRDGQDWGAIANKRSEVTASLADRTDLTLRYNAMVRAGAEARNCPFIDIAPAILDPSTGTIADLYRADDPNDHHLHNARAGRLWADALNRVDGAARSADVQGALPHGR